MLARSVQSRAASRAVEMETARLISLQDLAAIGAFLQGLAGILLVLGGLFAWHKYKAGKRVESIKWITEIGSRFYQFDKLGEPQRRRFEFDFFDAYAPAMEKWLVYPERLDERDHRMLAEIDALLNFFELICHVSAKDRYLHASDREAAFQYWFDDVIKRSEQHVLLRLYLHFGFEHLAKRVELAPPANRIAVYGTLLSDVAPHIRDPELREDAKRARQRLGRLVGRCRIRGRLVDLGEYPGLVLERGSTVGAELYELPFGGSGSQELRDFRSAIAAIDEFEGVNPDDPASSEYVRRYVQLDFPENAAAWVYVLNQPSRNAEPLDSGDWRKVYEQKLAADSAPARH
jgi:gamma-glutamylcyclotransferase (GGCT)/AIG2-like uncharacterized protein YtfP